ncbi:MAG TPA: sigma-70 family RNA polymerase sigma factor [Baekduia sp.]|nr:sigma-70 family RNA polymerase sigma factor [Baekduia sp.]
MDLTDPLTFSAIYDEHAPGVYATAMRVLGDAARAEDVTQDVFLRLWRSPRRFDERRGGLGPYLRLMARSRAVDVWREGQAHGRARQRLEHVVERAEPRSDERPDQVAEDRDRDRAVRSAVRALPESQREAVTLAYWGGLTAEEIARRAGVPLGTAKSRVRLGLGKLRADMGTMAEAA